MGFVRYLVRTTKSVTATHVIQCHLSSRCTTKCQVSVKCPKPSDPPSSAEEDKGIREEPLWKGWPYLISIPPKTIITLSATESSRGQPSTASYVLPGTGLSSLDVLPSSYSIGAGRMLLCYYSGAKSVCQLLDCAQLLLHIKPVECLALQ